jgi:2-polyprenyl-3-methyl-5-hydroxy-6-metoxy-1,4-benzoquinol methylase
MEYMGNKEFWDEKFAGRADRPLAPEASLVENAAYFKNGTVLDIACGDGRNALYLLEKGFGVTGVDFSDKALERLRSFAQRNGYNLKTAEVDLSVPGSLNGIGTFDNIIINHYRLDKRQIKSIGDHINDGGILFVCGFGHKHKTDAKLRKEDLIRPGDFVDIAESFELIKSTEQQDDRGFIVTYIFRRKYTADET